MCAIVSNQLTQQTCTEYERAILLVHCNWLATPAYMYVATVMWSCTPTWVVSLYLCFVDMCSHGFTERNNLILAISVYVLIDMLINAACFTSNVELIFNAWVIW